MLAMLVAYDATGQVIATRDYCVEYGPDGRPVGLHDFAAIERSGRPLLAEWNVQGAVGSKVWPEWLGTRAHEFRVELGVGPGGRTWIAALVHRVSGVRRERADIEASLADLVDAGGVVRVDYLVGNPQEPLVLAADGRTEGVAANYIASDLPLIRLDEGLQPDL